MKELKHCVTSALSLTAMLITLAPNALANHSGIKRYPNEGSIKYDGTHFAQAYFYWHNVGGWQANVVQRDQYGCPITEPRPGLELDVALSVGTYHDKCTSMVKPPIQKLR